MNTEQVFKRFVIQVRTDDAKAPRNGCRTVANIRLSGNIIKMDPLTVIRGDDSLGTQDKTVRSGVLGKRLEDLLQRRL